MYKKKYRVFYFVFLNFIFNPSYATSHPSYTTGLFKFQNNSLYHVFNTRSEIKLGDCVRRLQMDEPKWGPKLFESFNWGNWGLPAPGELFSTNRAPIYL